MSIFYLFTYLCFSLYCTVKKYFIVGYGTVRTVLYLNNEFEVYNKYVAIYVFMFYLFCGQ
jgi:hypothetical protein